MRILAVGVILFSSLCSNAFADPTSVQNIDALRAKADAGDLQAQLTLGSAYNIGKGVPLDYSESIKWFRKAAEKDNPTAQLNLGRAYEDGKGMLQDDAQAVSWFRKAAEQGDPDGLYSLGRMYVSGEGVRHNDVLAYMLFNIATASGHSDAARVRDSVGQLLTPDQLNAAQSLSTSWRLGIPLPQITSPELMAPQDLFQNTDMDRHEVYDSSKVLASGTIQINSQNVYVVLIQTKGDDCHVCGAKISAATYIKYGEQWSKYGGSVNFTQLGGWGAAPEQKGAGIQYIELKTSYAALIFIDDGSTGQGVSTSGEDLLYYKEPSSWGNVGFVATSEENSGGCDSVHSCYSWSGIVERRIVQGNPWPTLVVKATGTSYNNRGVPTPAHDSIYRFNGRKYVEALERKAK